MDFKETCEIFGGSVFYDDFRGDLTAIRDQLDTRQSQSFLVRLDDAASLILLRAIWNLLSGHINDSLDLLGYLTDDQRYGMRWAFRANVYKALLHCWRHHPRLFKFAELSGPAVATWRNLNPQGASMKALNNCAENSEDVFDIDRLEYRVIRELCRVDHLTRERARRINPDSEDFADHIESRGTSGQIVMKSKAMLFGLCRDTAQMGMVGVHAYLARQMYEVCHFQGLEDSHVHLEYMRKIYEQAEDTLGEGVYWLVRGDHTVSPAFTSPLVLNFDIVDGADEFDGDSRMFLTRIQYPDMREKPALDTNSGESKIDKQPKKRGIRSAIKQALSRYSGTSKETPSSSRPNQGGSVRQQNLTPPQPNQTDPQESTTNWNYCYDMAKTYFKRVGSARGLAATALRQACCLIMDSMQAQNYWSYERHYGDVRAFLIEAEEQCKVCGDLQLAKLVEIHIRLTENVTVPARLASREVGVWCETSGNDIMGLCLGLLCLRKSCYYRYEIGSNTQAVAAIEIGRQLIKSMTIFRTVWIQIMLAQADIWASEGVFNAAVVWLGHVKDRTDQIVNLCVSKSGMDDTEAGERAPTQLDIIICQHVLKMTAAAAVAIESEIGEPESFPDQETVSLLSMISRISSDDMTQEWRRLQDIKILYKKTLLEHKRHLQKSQLGEANRCLLEFLQHPILQHTDSLEARFYIVDIAAKYGEDEFAKSVLSTMKNDEIIPQLYTVIGRGHSTEEQRSTQRRRVKSLELIFLACIRAGDWKRADVLLGLLEEASPGYFTSVRSYTKLWPWQRCLYAGLVHEEAGRYNLSLQYYMQSWLFLKFIQESGVEQEERRRLWGLADVTLLFESLTRRSMKWQKDQPDVTKLEPTTDPRFNSKIFQMFFIDIDYTGKERMHFDDALLFLEAGKTQYVWQSAEKPRESSTVGPHYRYRKWSELKVKPNRSAEEEREYQLLDGEKDAWPGQIWGKLGEAGRAADEVQSGPEQFFTYNAGELYESIPENAIVIYTGLSAQGLTLMAVDFTGVIAASYSESITPGLVRNQVLAYLDALLDRSPKDDEDAVVLDILEKGLSNMLISEPIERCIDKRGHVIFVLSGEFTRIPVGALLYRNKYLGLQREVSQVPSLAVLRRLRRQRHGEINSKAEKATSRNTIIARPGSLADQRQTGMQPLPMAGIEAMLIGHILGTTPCNAKDINREQFQQLIQESEFLHVCTHGQMDPDYAFNSRISLGESFRVLDMLAVRTEVALVTFSACLSSMGHASESGDIQGFSHALLAAGANAYLGALWEINDVVSMVHMYLFYITLLVGLDTPTLAEAWLVATNMVYDMTTEQLVDMLQNIVASWDTWEGLGRHPGQFVRNGRKKLALTIEFLKTEDGAKTMDLKHPYFWAGFTLVGNGSLMVKSSGYELLAEMANGSAPHGRPGAPPTSEASTNNGEGLSGNSKQ